MGKVSISGSLRGQIAAAVLGSMLTLGAVAALVSAGGIALASHDSEAIHACVRNGSGLVRIVEGAAGCGPGETPAEWSRSGAAGVLSTEVRRVTGTAAANEISSFEVACLADEVVTGGGYEVASIGFEDKVFVSQPIDERTWMVLIHNDTDFTIDPVTVSAVCAKVVTP